MAYPLEPARVRWSIGKVGNGRSDPMPRAALHSLQHPERDRPARHELLTAPCPRLREAGTVPSTTALPLEATYLPRFARVRWSIGRVGQGSSHPIPRDAFHPLQLPERGTAPCPPEDDDCPGAINKAVTAEWVTASLPPCQGPPCIRHNFQNATT